MTEHPDLQANEDRYQDWDASYVLGALPTDERREYEQHLSTCANCREAVTELAVLPGILSRISPEEALAIHSPLGMDETQAPSETLSLMAHRFRKSQRRRRGVMALAVAAAVAAAVFGGLAVGARNDVGPATAQMTFQPMDPGTDSTTLTAGLQIEEKSWGTRLDWNCDYGADAPDNSRYELVVTQTDNTTLTVATWDAAGSRAADLSASTAIPSLKITSVEIRLQGSTVALARLDT